jgi:hypothetical protein
MTDQPASLAEALAVLQTQLPEVRKGQTAVVPTKSGGQYKYTYASLPDISQALLPLMGKLGLAWSCLPTLSEGRLVLAYVLLHISGEKLEGTYPLAGGTPQEIGSAITYARRYVLCSVTGLAADDDDDGTAASQPPSGRNVVAEARRREQRRPVEPQGDKAPGGHFAEGMSRIEKTRSAAELKALQSKIQALHAEGRLYDNHRKVLDEAAAKREKELSGADAPVRSGDPGPSNSSHR